ncbi:hypothetical protein [Paenibacillus sp. L3-i20]|uniref:hypothetical protein n=1 Tax=Paenibacillus sp. L3-i20 TaxID=2905833 RepID=UPI001EE006ED|nr:hypothetical protein [Paenibacillus sp. L3-i20]GKU79313.1 hypothetical protein L3i20_v237100 [Paenibacillus sp. L3-i20]
MNDLVKIQRSDLLGYMHLLEQKMLSNKMDYNRVSQLTFEGKDGTLKYLKEQNQLHRDTWVTLNRNGANGCVEIFNATKRREITRLLC